MTATTVPAKEITNPKLKSLSRYFPIIAWLAAYQRAWLPTDLIAGLTVVALQLETDLVLMDIRMPCCDELTATQLKPSLTEP